MRRLTRTLGAWFAVAALAPTAQAVEATFTLASATREACRFEYDGYYGEYLACDPPTAATLAPATPAGVGGTIDLDAGGELMRAVLNLEAYTVDGFAMPAWSGTLERAGSAVVRLAGGAAGPWPLATPNTANPTIESAFYSVAPFTSQASFGGTLDLAFLGDDLTRWVLHFAFASVPSSGAPACPGDRLLLDQDADGEIDARDANSWGRDGTFGLGVDQVGRTVAEFCGALPASALVCNRADFRNDEPQRKKPGDCRVVAQAGSATCRGAEYYGVVAQFPTPRTCLGLSVLDDADADGEPDRSDRCLGTPAGAAVDGDGCSAPQFCSLQSVGLCKRADFRNDEPTVKTPFDCAKTRTTPRTCEALLP